MKIDFNSDLAFVITAYQQVNLVLRNIKRIREEYPDNFNNCPIIIVSTSETDFFTPYINLYKNVFFIHFDNAPGNDSYVGSYESRILFKNKEPNWRYEFLPPRILISIQKGLEFATGLTCKYALHLHSDTFWHPKKIINLYRELIILENYLFIGDLSAPNEISSCKNQVLPPKMHFQPEGLLFNLEKSNEIGFSKFENIWSDNNFMSHNFGSIEALISQYSIYCLTEKLNIVNSYNDKIPSIYFNVIKIRTIRTYHGKFNSGLVNLNMSQDKVDDFSEADLIPPCPSLINIIHGLIHRYEP